MDHAHQPRPSSPSTAWWTQATTSTGKGHASCSEIHELRHSLVSRVCHAEVMRGHATSSSSSNCLAPHHLPNSVPPCRSDKGSSTIRAWLASNDTVVTIAGTPNTLGFADGVPGLLNKPSGLALGPNGVGGS